MREIDTRRPRTSINRDKRRVNATHLAPAGRRLRLDSETRAAPVAYLVLRCGGGYTREPVRSGKDSILPRSHIRAER